MSIPQDDPEEDRAPAPGPAPEPAPELAPPDDSPPADPPWPSEATLSAAVDTLAYPMLAVQPDGQLLHANVAARELLARGKPLELGSDGRVSPQAAGQRGLFATALQVASNGAAQQLIWADGERTVHATLRPLAEASAGTPPPPVLVMLAPSAGSLFDASGFATTHKLSQAERRVLEALLHGHQAEVTAQTLGVGVATVRTQIASIRRKTGHDSVASLLAALGNLPPLRHPGK